MNLSRNTFSTAGHIRKTLWVTALLTLMLTFAGRAYAGYKTNIYGVLVSYSGIGANAYYNINDNTLTVEVTESGGTLNITVGPDAPDVWGNFVDIHIVAGAVTLKAINIKGTIDCTPYVAGQVDFVGKFSLLNGVVGNTEAYGLNYGLGMVSLYIPFTISLKNSYCTAQLFGYPN